MILVLLSFIALPVSNVPRCGLLVAGLAGNNGVTLLAGQLANQHGLTWESSKDGPKSANCLGCITQVGGLSKKFEFSAFSDLAVGGWDVVPTPLGEALYRSRILDYDLVRQVRDEMDKIPVMRGVWDPDFYGDTQHEGATFIAHEATRSEQLDRLRADIRSFKAQHGLDDATDGGHTTVVWSASVERPCEDYESADELLDAIACDDKPNVSPSLVYACAAALEGCSFVNGGSQNTIQPALLELAARRGVGEASGGGAAYMLGTDFKAGQTKAKTAIVEYLRQLGLRVRTIASYNHLGNNDIRNLLSPRTWKAKERVKTDIFGPWTEADGEPIDHKVAVLYTEQMGDEKRDTVEYTSESFMGCEHTMLTYTRCMDSALCVPLMIDAAILCGYLHAAGASPDDAARALAYLFKLNEGAAIGVDPGFFHQSATLLSVLEKLSGARRPTTAVPATRRAASSTTSPASRVIDGGVLCAGLSCVDMQLLHAGTPASREAIAPFRGSKFSIGGSVSNTASALRALGVDTSVLTCAGEDVHGEELSKQYAALGIDTSPMIIDSSLSTSLAVLPVFESGGRGCWVDLSANDALTASSMLQALRSPSAAAAVRRTRALHVGYPHLLKGLQGESLRDFISGSSTLFPSPPLVSLDVNGATLGAFADADGVVGPALDLVDVFHANLEEVVHVVGWDGPELTEADATDEQLHALAAPLLRRGVGLVALTLGSSGAYVALNGDSARLARSGGALSSLAQESDGKSGRGMAVRLPALPVDGEVNANGAGDAFCAGLLAALLSRAVDGQREQEPIRLESVLRVALASARQRVDGARRDEPESAVELLTG
jgi:myo-inositol-1-phosphate synthase